MLPLCPTTAVTFSDLLVRMEYQEVILFAVARERESLGGGAVDCIFTSGNTPSCS